MGKAIKIISNLLFITGLLVAGLFLAAHFTGKQPFKVYIVSSGSMEPAIKTGSIVVVVPQSVYRVGDIISFKTSPDSKSTTTHRIVGYGDGFFKVAGDANDDPDPGLVPNSAVIGAVRWSVPYVGYLSAFAKTPRGFILLIIVPATIIIYEELKGFLAELKKFLSKFKSLAAKPESGRLNPAFIVLPIFFAVLVSVSLSLSFFLDKETSAGNIFGASAPGPTPTPLAGPTPTPTTSDPFIDDVPGVSGTFGHCCDANDLSSDPAVAKPLITGAPDSPPSSNFIQISDTSSVIGQFVNNKAVDGAGADIRIYIYDTLFPADALIEVSADCVSYSLAGIHTDTANVDIDLATVVPPLSEAKCVRLTDQVAGGDPYPTLGFDLDAIEALNSVAVL